MLTASGSFVRTAPVCCGLSRLRHPGKPEGTVAAFQSKEGEETSAISRIVWGHRIKGLFRVAVIQEGAGGRRLGSDGLGGKKT